MAVSMPFLPRSAMVSGTSAAGTATMARSTDRESPRRSGNKEFRNRFILGIDRVDRAGVALFEQELERLPLIPAEVLGRADDGDRFR